MKIGSLFWGGIFLFICFPLGLYFLFTIPELFIEDIKTGISLIKELKILHGLGILTRPIWSTAILFLCLVALAYVDEFNDWVVRKISGR